MPRISAFYGVLIYMYFSEHGWPHFHAVYGEHQATISLQGQRVIEGSLPTRALALVRQWARLHSVELATNWALGRAGRQLRPIPPLD